MESSGAEQLTRAFCNHMLTDGLPSTKECVTRLGVDGHADALKTTKLWLLPFEVMRVRFICWFIVCMNDGGCVVCDVSMIKCTNRTTLCCSK